VRIAVQLMQSEIKNERFTLISENSVFCDILNAMADGLGVKAWSHANPFLKSSGIGWFVSNVFQQERN
jgi:hypothetical protein